MRRLTQRRPWVLPAVLGGLALALAPLSLCAYAEDEHATQSDTATAIERAFPTVRSAWDAFRARHGNDWSVQWDFAAGNPRKLYGPGIDLTDQPLDAALVDALARGFLTENSGLYRVDDLALSGEASLHGSVWYLNYSLSHRGIPLDERSRIDFRLKPNGTLAMVSAYHLPRVIQSRLDYEVPSEVAVIAAESTLPVEGGPYVLRTEPSVQLYVDKAAVGRLVWRFELRNNRTELPVARDFSVLAVGEPEIVESRQRIFEVDVTGNVKSRTHLGDPTTAIQPQNLANIRVTVVDTGNFAFTDAGGNFVVTNAGSSNVTVRVGDTTRAYAGRFATVNNDAGLEEVFSTTATPGTPLNVVLNPAPSELITAQADGFLQTTRTHDFMASVVGETFGLGFAWPVNVNLAQTCNAYYDGVSTNFFQAGVGCNNTSYDSVAAHEYGHGIDDHIQGITDGALSEGIGDIVSIYLLGDPIVGRNFTTSGGFVRDGNNSRQWPASECGGEPHCAGEPFMGFGYKLRQNLIARLGSPAGIARANSIMLNSFFGNGPGIVDAVVDIYVQDDDDGNLNNGVPDQVDLDAAADFHNLPHPNPVFISITHSALPPLTTNSSVPYAVTATITTTTGSIASANVKYSLNGGSFLNAAMSPTGNPNQFTGNIPAQPCGTSLRYYIQATDTVAHTETLPGTAPASVFSFRVGIITQVFFDNMDAGDNGWTHVQIATQDDWQRGQPNQSGGNAYDPLTAYSGSSVWGNDLAPPGFNGNYANNVDNYLQSPNINATGRTGLHLRYRRWLTVEDGCYDQARILVNGTQVFQNPVGSCFDQFIDTSWVDHDIDISGQADNQASVQLRFTLTSDAGLTFGGWNIDDVSVESSSASGSLSMTMSDTTPSIGQPVTFNFTGVPLARVFVLSSTGLGAAAYQVPSGPLVTTGLQPPATLRASTSLNNAGAGQLTRSVPNRPGLIGRTFQIQSVDDVCSGDVSNIIAATVAP